MEPTAKKVVEPILSEAPLEEIRELAGRMPYVHLTLKRRLARGNMGFVAGMSVNTTDLADGTLERTLSETYGGGEFHVVAVNPENRMEPVLPKYTTSVDGMPKVGNNGVPTAPGDSRESRTMRLQMPMLQHAVPTGVLPGQPFFQPSQISPAPVPDGRAFMQRLPDEIASEHAQQLREDMQRMQTQFDEALRKAENRVEQLRADNERLRLEQRERDTKHEKDLADARFRDLEARLSNPPKPAIDVLGIATLLGTFVPVFTAMVSAGKDRAAAASLQQTEAAKLQMEGIKTMVTAGAKKPDFDLLELVKVGLPLIQAFQANRDPSKLAELMTVMGENQLGLLSMASNLMNQMGGESESPMMRIVQEAIAGAVNVAEKMASAKAEAMQPRQIQAQSPPLRQAAPPPAAAVSRRRVVPAAPATPAVEVPQSPDQLARLLLADPAWPSAMRGPEWQVIIRDIHDPEAPVPATAHALGLALDGLYDAGRLPPTLLPIFNGEDEELLANAQAFFDALPVREDTLRASALAEALAEVLGPEADDAAPAADDAAAAEADEAGPAVLPIVSTGP